MLKLYRLSDSRKEYWEIWQDSPGSHLVHWGQLGTPGQSRTIKSSLFRSADRQVQDELDRVVGQGFAPVAPEDHAILMIEYAVQGMGSGADVEKRHRAEDLMNEVLGWTGLGACDGGSIGSETMEVCNFVVDFDLAKQVVEEKLAGTEFADYTRIYHEGAA